MADAEQLQAVLDQLAEGTDELVIIGELMVDLRLDPDAERSVEVDPGAGPGGAYQLAATVPRLARLQVSSGAVVTVTGRVEDLSLMALNGGRVDASQLVVTALEVDLEQSVVRARPTESVSGWVVYGATLELLQPVARADVGTANAGRVVVLDDDA